MWTEVVCSVRTLSVCVRVCMSCVSFDAAKLCVLCVCALLPPDLYVWCGTYVVSVGMVELLWINVRRETDEVLHASLLMQ